MNITVRNYSQTFMSIFSVENFYFTRLFWTQPITTFSGGRLPDHNSIPGVKPQVRQLMS